MNNEAPDPVHGMEAERWGGWIWRKPSRARGEHYRTCSYCGSIHPEDLAAEDGWVAEWADRKYGWPHKFYVRIPNRRPEQRFVITADTHDADHSNDEHYTWVRANAIPEDVNTDGWGNLAEHYRWVGLGTRPTHHAKSYTVHLADSCIDPGVLESIQRTSGLRFHFQDGRVTWEPTA